MPLQLPASGRFALALAGVEWRWMAGHKRKERVSWHRVRRPMSTNYWFVMIDTIFAMQYALGLR